MVKLNEMIHTLRLEQISLSRRIVNTEEADRLRELSAALNAPSLDEDVVVSLFNPYHAKDGKFTTATGKGSGSGAAKKEKKASGKKGSKDYDSERKDYEKRLKDDRKFYQKEEQSWSDFPYTIYGKKLIGKEKRTPEKAAEDNWKPIEKFTKKHGKFRALYNIRQERADRPATGKNSDKMYDILEQKVMDSDAEWMPEL